MFLSLGRPLSDRRTVDAAGLPQGTKAMNEIQAQKLLFDSADPVDELRNDQQAHDFMTAHRDECLLFRVVFSLHLIVDLQR